jgi:hypothetical protein
MANSTLKKQDSASDPSKKWEQSSKECILEWPKAENGLALLYEIHVNLIRLCQCSKCFELLMSGRWTGMFEFAQSSSNMKSLFEV